MLDLSTHQRLSESLMLDRCTVAVDADGASDDVLDPATGQLVRPDGDTATVYTGPCRIRPAPSERVEAEGGGFVWERLYVCRVPLDTPPLPAGATLTVTAAYRDPGMVGRAFTVRPAAAATFATSRRLSLEARDEAAQR